MSRPIIPTLKGASDVIDLGDIAKLHELVVAGLRFNGRKARFVVSGEKDGVESAWIIWAADAQDADELAKQGKIAKRKVHGPVSREYARRHGVYGATRGKRGSMATSLKTRSR